MQLYTKLGYKGRAIIYPPKTHNSAGISHLPLKFIPTLNQNAARFLSECQTSIRFWHFPSEHCHEKVLNYRPFSVPSERAFPCHMMKNQPPHHTFGKKILSFESLDSTNRLGKEILGDSAEGTVIVADEQTAGRGRMGRKWISEKGKNLTCSIILKPALAPEYLGVVSLFAGVVVARTIFRLTGLSPTCKWPNDVLLNRKKCCGILAESTLAGNRCTGIVLGIGININQREFPPELLDTATSLCREAGQTFEPSHVLSILLEEIESEYPILQRRQYETIREAWAACTDMIGVPVVVTTPNGPFEGTAAGIDDTGALIVRREGVEERFTAGEISLQYDHDRPRN